MLFKTRFHEPIRRGEITCTVRIWQRPHVTTGGRYAFGSGSIEVGRIQEIGFESLTPALARRCGFSSLVDLLKIAKHGPGERVFLIDFRYRDTPIERAPRTAPSANELDELVLKLDGMDRRSAKPWTREVLQLIADHPGTRATDLAAQTGRERDEFKRDVRKLKTLGLTISLEVGYELSPRGKRVLAADRRRSVKHRRTPD
ncbi:hypothetical protein HNQ60_002627 [Povalibacter uvarum]|uniref:ASCH domain-containing protein n=1 Tax=Povalibacter uvarum TaxID=732238 RepID=A0A841HLJ5_9GAMM|nr:hypothetical protein [Povalibacter uvarum]MBB6093746.1 hypothetical protein [Povalibacter uvarum]